MKLDEQGLINGWEGLPEGQKIKHIFRKSYQLIKEQLIMIENLNLPELKNQTVIYNMMLGYLIDKLGKDDSFIKSLNKEKL